VEASGKIQKVSSHRERARALASAFEKDRAAVFRFFDGRCPIFGAITDRIGSIAKPAWPAWFAKGFSQVDAAVGWEFVPFAKGMDFFSFKPETRVPFLFDIVENAPVFDIRDSFEQIFSRITGRNDFPGVGPTHDGKRRKQD
jgi:hypothetical protein